MTTIAGSRLPLSAAQQEIWIAHEVDGANPRYNCGGYVEVRGALDTTLLAQAVRQAMDEAEALRVRFTMDDEGPWQRVAAAEAPLHLLSVAQERAPQQAAEAWMRSDLGRPVSLAEGPLFTHALLSNGPDHHFFYFRYHHILVDGFGQALYWRRLAEIYSSLARGQQAGAAKFGSLADLLAEDSSYRDSPRRQAERAYWLEVFARPSERVSLADRSSAQLSRNVLRRVERPPASSISRLQQASVVYQTHWSVIAIAATAAYLHRLTQQEDIVIGLPVRARTSRLSLATPGMLANELPLRLSVRPEMRFADVVRQVSTQVSQLLGHQRYRGEELQRELRRAHGSAEPAAVTVNVVSFDEHLDFGGHRGTIHQLSSGPVRDLQIEFFGGSNGAELQIYFDANAELHDAEALATHQRRFAALLDTITAEEAGPLGQLPLLLPEDATRLTEALTGRERPYDLSRCLHELVDEQARKTPQAIAVATATSSLDYASLAEQSDRLAAHLVRLGVVPGQPVGVHEVRSIELVVSLLAVLKAGAAYLPLDPELPPSRLEFQVRDAGVSVVLSRSTLSHQLDGCGVKLVPVDTVLPQLPATEGKASGVATPDSPAYVIYTSGSTGLPKGVMVPHRGVVNRLLWMQEEYRLGPDDCVLQKTPFTFDVSVWEFFWPLLVGCRLFMAEPGGHLDPRYVARAIREHRVTTLHFVPPMLDLFLAEPESATVKGLRRVVCSGESLRPETVRAFFERFEPAKDGIALHNLYGPTEASIDVTYWECRPEDAAGPIPIGRPVANTPLYVLDRNGERTPPGVAGELYIGGVQVALGYLNRPELTRERFVPNPFGPGRLYRTGDLVRCRRDGALEFLGRFDDQVKVRGNRIELGEIESALLAHPAVSQAAVIAPQQSDGQRQIVAYLVPSSQTVDLAQLSAALQERLPEYMIPAHFVVLGELPLLPNGKLNRKALPTPTEPAARPASPGTSPATPNEELLSRVWCKVLGIGQAGVTDSFFALGGDSMSAIRVRTELERHGRTFTISELFEGPSIRELARTMRPLASESERQPRTQPFELVSPADRARLPAGIDDAYPLSAMQAGMLYHASYAEHSSIYRVVTCVRVAAKLDLGALSAAVADTAGRHPSLRCSFDLTHYSEPLQLVHREVVVPVDVAEDLSGLDAQAQQRAMQAWVERAKFTQFVPEQPPLLRFTVHPCGPSAFQFLSHRAPCRPGRLERHAHARGGHRPLPGSAGRAAAVAARDRLDVPGIRGRRTAGDCQRPVARVLDLAAARRRAHDPGVSCERLAGLGEPAVRRVPIPGEQAERLRKLARREGLPLKALLIVMGIGMGMFNPPRASVTIGVAEPAKSGMASGMGETFQQVGVAIGIAAFGALFHHRVVDAFMSSAAGKQLGAQAEQFAHATVAGSGVEQSRTLPSTLADQVAEATRSTFVHGLTEVMVICAIVCGVGAVIAFAFIRRRDLHESALHSA